MDSVIEIKDVHKNYGSVEAVRGISFAVAPSSCFGLLGPNGAGKTTTIEIMEGIQKPNSGAVYFKGQPLRWPVSADYKDNIGIQFQQSALPEFITVRETLQLFSSFYSNPRPIEEIVKLCSLEDIIKRDNRKLSGGQRQRMLLGLAIISRPAVLFLDEPTTGLDPQARRNFWELIERIKQEKTTILLTTHYMDEAEILCDTVAIVDLGTVLEIDSPQALLQKHFEGAIIRIPWSNSFTTEHAKPLADIEGARSTDKAFEIDTTAVDNALSTLLKSNIPTDGLSIHTPNLEDLFIKLTGSSLRS